LNTENWRDPSSGVTTAAFPAGAISGTALVIDIILIWQRIKYPGQRLAAKKNCQYL